MPHRPELPELLQQHLGAGYELEHELTGAGMSRVFVAREVALDRRVVVKVLPPDLVTDAALARFRREVQVTARLQHPHILPVLSLGGAGSFRYYVTPFVPSESLRRHLAAGHRLPFDQALSVALELLGALALAHGHGIIHRDVKPGNVLLSGRHAILADFGIARALHEDDDTIAPSGSLPAVAAYVPPEGPRGDAAGDLWALAVLVHEAITGAIPPLPASAPALLDAWRAADPSLDAAAGALAAAAMTRALDLDPDRRFRDANAFADALRMATRATGSIPSVPVRAHRFRSPRVLAGAGLAAAIAIGGATATWRSRDAAGTEADPLARRRVVVHSLMALGDSGAASAARSIGQLLASNMDEVDGVVRVAAADANADTAGAWAHVSGRVLATGRALRVELELRRAGATPTPLRLEVEGSADSIAALADRVTIAVLPALYPPLQHGPSAAAISATTSPDAVRHFMEGELLLERGASDSAFVAFRTATDLDPSYALAWYRRAVAAERAVRVLDADSAAVVARTLAGTLPLRERLLVEGFAAMRAGENERARGIYQRLIEADWGDAEVWLQLAEIGYHVGPVLGHPIEESRDAWDRVVSLDSSDVSAVTHAMRLASRRRDMTALAALGRRLQKESSSGTYQVEAQVFAALAGDDAEAIRRANAALDTLPDYSLHFLHSIVTGMLERPDLARPIALRLVQPRRPVTVRAQGHVALAYLAMTVGQPREAWARLDSAALLDPAAAALARASLATLPFVTFPPALLDSAATMLRALRSTHSPTPLSLELVADEPALPVIRAYLMALLELRRAAQLRSVSGAALPRPRLDCARTRGPAADLCHDLAHGIDAERDVLAHDANGALASLDAMELRVPYQLASRSIFMARTRERWLRAQLLADAGWGAEAVQWFGAVTQPSRLDYVYLAPAHLHLARLREQASDRRGALMHYQAVLNLLRSPDREFVPMRAEAERGVTRVR